MACLNDTHSSIPLSLFSPLVSIDDHFIMDNRSHACLFPQGRIRIDSFLSISEAHPSFMSSHGQHTQHVPRRISLAELYQGGVFYFAQWICHGLALDTRSGYGTYPSVLDTVLLEPCRCSVLEFYYPKTNEMAYLAGNGM